jgi:isoquinoline 1-oxidoreductase subunit alpha
MGGAGDPIKSAVSSGRVDGQADDAVLGFAEWARSGGEPGRQQRLGGSAARGARQAMVSLTVNGKDYQADVDPRTPLLWVLRDALGLTGTKYGCGIAQCGACTVHLDGVAARSCSVPVSAVGAKRVTTIEGLAQADGGRLHKVQQAWLDRDVPQCGYCQSGMIMAVAALLKSNPSPSDADIDSAITNICRCGTYQQVREAVHLAAKA